jgi:hypothetical protein
MTNDNGVPVQVVVTLGPSPKDEKTPQAVAYAYTDTGHFLTKAPVDAKGTATLHVRPAEMAQQVRIVVGPESHEQQPTQGGAPAFSELARRGAQEQFVRVEPDAKSLKASFTVPADIWRCWIRFCFVKGNLLKRIYSSGIAIDYPVCGVSVSVWEVEPIIILISKLADVQLDKIRQYMLNPQPLPPGPDPGPERFRVAGRLSFSDAAFNPQPDPPGDPIARIGQLEVGRPVSTVQEFSVASTEFESVHRAAVTGDLSLVRQSLLTINENAARYLICLLFPRWVTKRLLTTLSTDRCGHFQGRVFLSCYEAANLYFSASVRILGFDIPIYEPAPVSCYTHWNYRCGDEVTLYTNSPLAPLCMPCLPVDAPENYVLFRALGNVQLNGIYGASPVLSAVTTAANEGLAAALYSDADSPFGGNVLPRVEFDSSLRAQNKATYYQISYRQGTMGDFSPLVGSVDRKYNHFVGPDLVTSVYNLGPKAVNGVANLFEIPPALPPEGDWAFPNPPVDLANAQFPTTTLPPFSLPPEGTHGKYQLQLELFDSNGALVDIAAAGIKYFVPTTVDPDGTIHTADAASIGLVSGNSFIVTVHVDNRATSGALLDPTLDSHAADGCGVFRYSPGPAGNVAIPFTATHPDNFATYSYRLSRGATPLTPPSIWGVVSGATNPATLSMSVASLLTQPDGTVCDTAGFAEDLYVAALATDGWSRLAKYDSNPQPRAFVLAPET